MSKYDKKYERILSTPDPWLESRPLINKSDALLHINCFIHMEQAFGPNQAILNKLLHWKRTLQRLLREEKSALNNK
jgi:hypothetical protein